MAKRSNHTPNGQPNGSKPNRRPPPPVEHRWPKGVSGNPKGRPSAGATLREWVNQFATKNLTELQLRKIIKDKKAPWTKRAAAERCLRTLEAPNMADFEPYLNGDQTLRGLSQAGVNTELVKKTKSRRKTFTDKDGNTEVTDEREVELHDRSGVDFDRVSDRTEGRPTQRLDHNHDGSIGIRDTAQGESEANSLLAALRASLGVKA